MVVCYNVLDCKLNRISFAVTQHNTVFVSWIGITYLQHSINILNMYGQCLIHIFCHNMVLDVLLHLFKLLGQKIMCYIEDRGET
jgi:hypothetical protein